MTLALHHQRLGRHGLVAVALALVLTACAKKSKDTDDETGAKPGGSVVVTSGPLAPSNRVVIPVDFAQGYGQGFSLTESATSYTIQLTDCLSGYSTTVTDTNLDGLEVYKYDRDCLAKLTQFEYQGRTYVPTAGDPFTTWQRGDIARFDEAGEPGIAPLDVVVVSTLGSPILSTDVIHFGIGLPDGRDGADHGFLWSTVGRSAKLKVGASAPPSYTVRSIELTGLDAISGAARYKFVFECSSDIGISNACAGVSFGDLDYKLVKDTFSDAPTKTECDTIFATAGAAVMLPGDRVAPGSQSTTNGGFETSVLAGPGDLATNNNLILVVRSYGASYQYFNIDTLIVSDYRETDPPTITTISTAHADGAFGPGEVIDIDVTFSEPIALTGSASTLDLDSGGTAVYLAKPAAATLRFRYTVQSGDISTDLDVTSYQLNGDGIVDGLGNAAALSLPTGVDSLAGSAAIVISEIVPVITSIATGHANGSFTVGEVIDIDVTFDYSMTITGTASTLTLDSGGVATYLSQPSASVLRYRYTVSSGQTTSDLDVTTYSLNGDTIQDALGNDADLSLPSGASSLAGSAAIVLDTAAPTITNITSSLANGSYSPGQVIPIQVTYSEAVTLAGTGPGVTLLLETGTTDRTAVYASGSGTTVLTFNYTVQAGDVSSDLNTNASAPQFALTGTSPTLKDAAGNDASLAVGGTTLATNKNIVIDTNAPSITNISSSTPNGTYGIGQVISIQVTYSESVILAGTGPGITLSLETGTTDRTATYASGSGTATLTFAYTVQAGDVSTDLNTHATAPQLTLTGTSPTLRDGAGNNASLTVAGTTLATNKDIVIDTTGPSVTNVTSSTPNGTYGVGQVVSIQVTFSEVVILAGTSPGITLLLETGGTDRTATYVSGSGGTTLSFDYTVQTGDTSTDLNTNASGPQLVLTGTTPTLKDVSGNSAVLSVGGTSLATNKALVIDTTAPPALKSFSGAACCTVNSLKANAVELSIGYPVSVTDISSVVIRRAAGASAPVDCTSDAYVTTLTGPFTGNATVRYTDDAGAPGSTYSYRACVTDAAGNQTGRTALSVTSAKFSWIFATSTSTYTGNLGGVAAADAVCAAAGAAVDSTLSWVAVLSTTGLDAKGRAPVRGSVYNRATTPVAVATSFSTMWAGTWAAAVTYDQSGASVTGNTWTGSTSAGVLDRASNVNATNNHCSDWTSAAVGQTGRYGNVAGTGANWAESGTQACSGTGRLYCMSKTIEPLAAFSAATGTTTDGNVSVSITFPGSTTDYNKVEIRRKAGSAAPSSACTDTLVKTYNSPTFTTETFVDATGVAGAFYSYIACVYDAAGIVATTSTLPVRTYATAASHVLFVSSTTLTGNLGGLTGGDAICQTLGNKLDRTKTWQFVASDSATDAVTRLVITGAVRLVDGTSVATSEADFFDGTLAATISIAEDGTTGVNDRAWTGSGNNGIKKGAGLYCTDWTVGTNAASGRRGRTSTTSSHFDTQTSACNTASRIYCISSTAN